MPYWKISPSGLRLSGVPRGTIAEDAGALGGNPAAATAPPATFTALWVTMFRYFEIVRTLCCNLPDLSTNGMPTWVGLLSPFFDGENFPALSTVPNCGAAAPNVAAKLFGCLFCVAAHVLCCAQR